MEYKLRALLVVLIIDLQFLTECESNGISVSDDAEQEQSMKTLTNSRTLPTVRGRGGRVRMWRRRRKCVKWCTARIKAKEIVEVDWKKVLAFTVFIIGVVHIVYFCHPVCHPY